MTTSDDIRTKRREFKRKYRERHRTYSLSFRLDEANELERRAEGIGRSVPNLIRHVLSTHEGNNGYIVPPDSKLQDLLLALRRIANNINQLVRYCHSVKAVGFNEVERLTAYLAEIELVIKESLTKPPKIEELIKEELRRNPMMRQKLLTLLNDGL